MSGPTGWGLDPWGAPAEFDDLDFVDPGEGCGLAAGWDFATVVSIEEQIGFNDASACLTPIESFEGGWFSNEAFLFALSGGNLDGADLNYNPQTGFPIAGTAIVDLESFEAGWPAPPRLSLPESTFPYPPGVTSGNETFAFDFDSVSSDEGVFNEQNAGLPGAGSPGTVISGLSTTTIENFEQGWPAPVSYSPNVYSNPNASAGNEAFTFVFSGVQGTWNDPSTDLRESFEINWNNNTYLLDFSNPSNISQALMDGVNLRSAWLVSSTDIWAVGNFGSIVHYDGTSWSSQASNVSVTLYGVWARSNADVWAVGANATILHFDGTEWSSIDTSSLLNTNNVLFAVVGDPVSQKVWFAGSSGKVLFWDGSTLTTQNSGLSQAIFSLSLISASNVWAVGAAGSATNFNGSIWTTSNTGVSTPLNGVFALNSTHVWAVGDTGTIRFFNGSAWSAQTSGTSQNLYGVAGFNGTDLTTVGANSVVLRSFDGTTWSAASPALPVSGILLRSVVYQVSSQFWVFGDTGHSFFFNASSWSPALDSDSVSRLLEQFDFLWESAGTLPV